jgi:hypothetical protein
MIDHDSHPATLSAILKVQRQSRYGSIEGLGEEELADPKELERQVMAEEGVPTS